MVRRGTVSFGKARSGAVWLGECAVGHGRVRCGVAMWGQAWRGGARLMPVLDSISKTGNLVSIDILGIAAHIRVR